MFAIPRRVKIEPPLSFWRGRLALPLHCTVSEHTPYGHAWGRGCGGNRRLRDRSNPSHRLRWRSLHHECHESKSTSGPTGETPRTSVTPMIHPAKMQ